MNAKPLVGAINLPRRPTRGLDVMTWAADVNRTLQQLRDRKALYAPKGRNDDTLPPFWPTFSSTTVGETTTWYCTVTRGVVEDHAVDDGDALVLHEVPNQFDGDALARFEMTAPAVYVKIPLLATGEVDGVTGCEIVIDVDGKDSLTNAPPIEADSGSAGTLYRKLATLVITAGVPTITRFGAGDNITHSRKPIFKAASGGEALFTKYNLATGQYDYKAIAGIAPIDVSTNGEVIEVKLDSSGGNMNVRIEPNWAPAGYSPASPAYFIYFRNGLFVGDVDPADAPAGLIEIVVAGTP